MVLRWDLFSIFAIDELITEWIYETNKLKTAGTVQLSCCLLHKSENKNIYFIIFTSVYILLLTDFSWKLS